MSEYDDDRDDRRPRKLIYDAREQVQAARNEVYNELVGHGAVSLRARRQLATATVQYWDTLREHRDEREDEWEESGVDLLADAIGSTVAVKVDAPGRTQATRTEERPALLAIDPERILDISKRLDELANDLGFGASVSEAGHRTEITDELIEEVEEWRQQNLA